MHSHMEGIQCFQSTIKVAVGPPRVFMLYLISNVNRQVMGMCWKRFIAEYWCLQAHLVEGSIQEVGGFPQKDACTRCSYNSLKCHGPGCSDWEAEGWSCGDDRPSNFLLSSSRRPFTPSSRTCISSSFVFCTLLLVIIAARRSKRHAARRGSAESREQTLATPTYSMMLGIGTRREPLGTSNV